MNKLGIVHSPKSKGILLVLLTGCCWGFHGVIIKLAFAMGASFLQVFLAEVFLASLFFACLYKRFFSHTRPSCPQHYLEILLAGLATIAVGNLLFLSFSLGPVAIGATLLFMYLPQVYLYGLLFKKESFQLTKLIAILLLLAGATLATEIISSLQEESDYGAILSGLGASSCYAFIFLVTPRMSQYTSSEFRSFSLSVIGSIGCLIILLLQPQLWQNIHGSGWQLILLLLCLLLVGQVIPVYSLMKGLPLTGSHLGSVLASVELPIAVLSAALILQEPLTLSKALGVSLVLGGIVIYNIKSCSQPNPKIS